MSSLGTSTYRVPSPVMRPWLIVFNGRGGGFGFSSGFFSLIASFSSTEEDDVVPSGVASSSRIARVVTCLWGVFSMANDVNEVCSPRRARYIL